MKFINLVSLRYIFSHKRHNTINLITWVSMCGVAVGVFAIVVIMSVINGLENVVQDSFSKLDPHLKISSAYGKVFSINDSTFALALQDPNIAASCLCIEHEGMITYNNQQIPITIKGVSSSFASIYDIDQILYDGDANFSSRQIPTAVIGIGLANTLNIGVQYNSPATIYTVKRGAKINIARPDAAFTKKDMYICGIINSGQNNYNESTAIVSIETARELFRYDKNNVSYIEIMANNETAINKLKASLQNTLGEKYIVEDRYEQQADFYKILKIEKWMSFLILSFILLIATFNVIGSLSMIMIEKRNDITLFRNLGATNDTIVKLFTLTGWIITNIGAMIGLLLGIAACLIQQHFGIIKMSSLNIQDYYPVEIQACDCLIVFLTVFIMAFATSYYPVKATIKAPQSSK